MSTVVNNVPFVDVNDVEKLLTGFTVTASKKKKSAQQVFFYKIEVAGKQFRYGNTKEWKTLSGAWRSFVWTTHYCMRTDQYSAIGAFVRNNAGFSFSDQRMLIARILQDLVLRHEVVIWSRPEDDINGWVPMDVNTINWKKLRLP